MAGLVAAKQDHDHRRRRRARLLTLTAAALVTATASAFVGLDRLQRVEPLTVDAARARYRALGQEKPAGQAETGTDGALPDPVAGPDGGGVPVAAGGGPAAGGAPETAAGARAAARPGTVSQAGGGHPGGAPLDRPAGGPTVMEPGVYVYKTKGYEEVSVLGGSRHTYPEETTMTVRRTACGYDVRWDALKERWEQAATCMQGGAVHLHTLEMYREFFQQVDRRVFTCTPETRIRPDRDTPGGGFGGRCESDGSVVSITGTVVGTEDVVVAGRPVASVRVRLDQQLSGASKGTRVTESWYAVTDGLLLKRTSLTDTDAKSAMGDTHYREDVVLELTSTTPLR